ncbi:hypothetical protein TNCT_222011 [Trichonephila clavata]|uniref:Uncharacterized protein n=1 Tax=Trichonephila clavata TaxID=2740835 RepID=A0A8X6LGL9_TRICU|nr:hypothetical protein TNCT_222011 [Trichonephila clavata]
MTDDDRSGRSATSIIDKNVAVIDSMIRKNGRVRSHDIVNDLNISYGSVSIGASSPVMMRERNAFTSLVKYSVRCYREIPIQWCFLRSHPEVLAPNERIFSSSPVSHG